MSSREIHDVFRDLAGDDRFLGAGLALGREVVEGAIVYEIRLSAFDFDSDALTALRKIAEQEGLAIETGSGGIVLRQSPRHASVSP